MELKEKMRGKYIPSLLIVLLKSVHLLSKFKYWSLKFLHLKELMGQFNHLFCLTLCMITFMQRSSLKLIMLLRSVNKFRLIFLNSLEMILIVLNPINSKEHWQIQRWIMKSWKIRKKVNLEVLLDLRNSTNINKVSRLRRVEKIMSFYLKREYILITILWMKRKKIYISYKRI